jgi:excisionase family DNA binding protein
MPPMDIGDRAAAALAKALADTVTLAEAAELTGLSVRTIRRAVDSGTLDSWLYGGRVRVERDQLRRLFRRRVRPVATSREW